MNPSQMTSIMARRIALPLLVASTLLLAFAPGSASAGESGESNESSQLMSYAELMELTPPKRIEYIEGVQKLLIDLSKNKNGRISDSDPKARTRLKAMLESFVSEIKTADAQSADSDSQGEVAPLAQPEIAPIVIPTHLTPPPVAPAQSSSTLTNRERIQIETTPTHKHNAFTTFINGTSSDYRVFKCRSSERGMIAPEPEYQGISRSCSPSEEAELKKLHEERRVAASKAAVKAKPAAALSAEAAPAGREVRAATKPEIKSDAKPAATSAATSDAKPAATSAATSPAKPAAVEGAPKAASVSQTTAKAAESPAPTAGSGLSCAPKPQVCEDTKLSRALAFSGEAKSCIFAGMISKLDKGNRKCSPVMEFQVGSEKLKCAAGQTMCNPMIFGAVNTTTPICVGRGHDVTLQCSKLSSARDAERFINRNAIGIKDTWDKFKKEFDSLCDPKTPSAKFHCAECNIMRTRMFEINARIVGKNICGSRSASGDYIGTRTKYPPPSTAPAKKSGGTVK